MLKHVGNGAGCAHLALAFGKRRTHFTDGSIGVIGQAIDQQHSTARTKPLVTRDLEIFTDTRPCLINGFFNDMGRNLVFFCSV